MEATGPFSLAGDDRGVLLLHGFAGTPFETRPLGERLHRAGFTVEGPVLVGHDRDVAALDATTWRDWVGGAQEELVALAARCRRVAVVGLSLGGLIALHLARVHGDLLAALGALAVPLWLPAPIRLGLRLLGPLARHVRRPLPVPKLIRGGDCADLEMRRRNPELPAFSLAASVSLRDFTEVVRAELGEIRVPAFVAHGARDRAASPACARELAARLGGEVRSLVLARSRHLVTIDLERDQLGDALAAFLVERM